MDSVSSNEPDETLLRIIPCKNGPLGFLGDKYLRFWIPEYPVHSLTEKHIWCLEMDLLERLSEEKVEFVLIGDAEHGRIYVTSLNKFRDNGVPYLDPECGPLLCLPLSFWKVTEIPDVNWPS
jgi:hypothetical protein